MIKEGIGTMDRHNPDRTIPIRTIYARLDRMVKAGILQMRGRGKGTMYEYKINDALGIEPSDRDEKNDLFVELANDYDEFVTNGISKLGYRIINKPAADSPSRKEAASAEEVMEHA